MAPRAVAGWAAAVGVAAAALAAQALAAGVADPVWILQGARFGITVAWLTLTAMCVATALISLARRRAGDLRDWQCAILVTSLTAPRFRGDIAQATVAAFWICVLLICGAAVWSDTVGRRGIGVFWAASALLLAPWGLLPGVPRWP